MAEKDQTIQNMVSGVSDNYQLLSAYTDLTEDLSLLPSSHTGWLTTIWNSSSGDI